ncbi:hypothetical protein OS493_022248 [Desmophyllum pertusum]|uniref:Uncharacterized protein n=1 Tax=Desmophyllum pertusum TaxID=174260 RepID=A0A9W9YE98_9CNID|nr:hypothetical protein OS493_022248 [Desmophyllum pertusum]
MNKILITTLLLGLVFFWSGGALIRGGRDKIPTNQLAAEGEADVIYEMYDKAEKVPRYSKREKWRGHEENES